MSAIGGIIQFDGTAVDRAAAERMQAALAIYGRDAQHHRHLPAASLVRTLLRTTPEDYLDAQPLVDTAEDIALVFDGRIDNREELAEALGIGDDALARMADSDLVLRACREWDDDTPRRLLGDFALACWRPGRRTLWLARDPLGMRPLFWHEQPGRFAFATMPKGLFALPGVPRELNGDFVEEQLCLLPMTTPDSYYKGIFRVQQGELVSVRDGEVQRRYYHRFTAPRRELKLESDEAYVALFRRELERAVRCRLRTIGPVATTLSSGLDSTTVTALAARQLEEAGQPLLAYTAVPRPGFDGPVLKGRHADEWTGAALTAERFANIEHQAVDVSHLSLLETLEEQIELLERPPGNPCNAVWFNELQKMAAARGARALLMGSMGNATISWSGLTCFATLLRRGRFVKFYREAQAFRRCWPGASWRWLLKVSLLPNLPGPLWRAWERRRRRLLQPESYSAIRRDVLESKRLQERALQRGRDLHLQPTWSGHRDRINVLTLVDPGEYFASANALGVEVRDPTGDRRLVELCLAMPDDQFQHRGELASLLKRAMRGLVPDEVLEAKTRGLQAPDWFEKMDASRSELEAQLEAIARDSSAGEHIDLEGLRESLREWPSDPAEFSRLDVQYKYRSRLLRGVGVGYFIRYLEKYNAS